MSKPGVSKILSRSAALVLLPAFVAACGMPAVSFINTDERITFAYVNPVYRYRLHPDLLLVAAEASLDGRNVCERVDQ